MGGGDLLASPQERYYNSFHLLTNQNKPGMVHIFEYTSFYTSLVFCPEINPDVMYIFEESKK